ncbi:hypothetical protein LPUS_05194 [Lasallia pustulata]|uniref:SnoaL-like domain-containing protein n=1 Tax=Lasallia pustulata TaxID=136370 RepID=A0A1W5CYB7_9LECA|nr:hypothetical protein LPUS_05194 [Lasallia pustulata]
MRLPVLLTTLSSLPLLLATPYYPIRALTSRTHNVTYCPPRPATERQQRAIFNDFVSILYGDKNPIKAFDTYVALNLTEHDPFDAQGRDANAAKLAAIVPYAQFTVLRQNFDNNLGFIHVRIEDNPEPDALADIYRMDGTCIVEHWDIVQARPANATNPIAMF